MLFSYNHPMEKEIQKKSFAVSTEKLAEMMGWSPGWVGAWLQSLGVAVRDDGVFDPAQLRDSINAASRKRIKEPRVRQNESDAMGETEESCRLWLINVLHRHGLRVIHRQEAGNSRFTLERPDGKLLWIATHVALRSKTHPSQVGFCTSPHSGGDIYEYYFFIAQPLGRVYVLSKREIKDRWRKNHTGNVGRMGITFSAGVDEHLLENRLHEILAE
jgi:hypothetical protein